MIVRALKDIWSAFSEFNDQALLFALVAVLIYTIVTIAVYLVKTVRSKPHKSLGYLLVKLVLFTIFGVYCSYAISLTLSGREAGSRSSIVNLVPFSTFTARDGISLHTVENCLLFVPFGILLPILYKYHRNLLRVTLMGFISSVLIELAQIMTKRGYFEIDDILLNTFGTVVGYLIFAIVYDGFLADRKRFVSDFTKKENITEDTHITSVFNKGYDRFAQNNRVCLFVLQVIPIAASFFMIMGFSSDNGDESSSLSKALALKVATVIKKLSPGGTDTYVMSNVTLADILEGALRKMAHVCEYAVMAFFIWALIYSFVRVRYMVVNIATVAMVMLVGALDEINQSHTPGRCGTPRDVLVDCIGALLVIICMRLTIAICEKHLKKRIG